MADSFHFFAYLSRMKLIDRWALMRCTQRENVQEHSLQVAAIAHALAVIKNKFYGGKVNADRVATTAIFHDANEVLTGDLPTPVKYFNEQIRSAYVAIEDHAVEQMLKLLPDELKDEYKDLLFVPDEEVAKIVKAADTIAAYVKCLEEVSAGNHEFSKARKTIGAKVEELRVRPEVDYFVRTFIPSFSLTIDDISKPIEI